MKIYTMEAGRGIKSWLTIVRPTLAVEKTKAVLITNRKRKNIFKVKVGAYKVITK